MDWPLEAVGQVGENAEFSDLVSGFDVHDGFFAGFDAVEPVLVVAGAGEGVVTVRWRRVVCCFVFCFAASVASVYDELAVGALKDGAEAQAFGFGQGLIPDDGEVGVVRLPP